MPSLRLTRWLPSSSAHSSTPVLRGPLLTLIPSPGTVPGEASAGSISAGWMNKAHARPYGGQFEPQSPAGMSAPSGQGPACLLCSALLLRARGHAHTPATPGADSPHLRGHLLGQPWPHLSPQAPLCPAPWQGGRSLLPAELCSCLGLCALGLAQRSSGLSRTQMTTSPVGQRLKLPTHSAPCHLNVTGSLAFPPMLAELLQSF